MATRLDQKAWYCHGRRVQREGRSRCTRTHDESWASRAGRRFLHSREIFLTFSRRVVEIGKGSALIHSCPENRRMRLSLVCKVQAYKLVQSIISTSMASLLYIRDSVHDKSSLFSEQEHARTTETSDVDDRTQHEIYAHPFLRSVMAGVASVMCSYSRLLFFKIRE